MYVKGKMFWELIIVSAPREKKKTPSRRGCVRLFESERRRGSSPTREREKKNAASNPGTASVLLLRATSVYGFAKKSLVHVPDFGQQWRKLLVLEAEGEYLLRVDAAERAQAHQLHQHAGKHQVILRRHLTPGLIRPRP